MNRPIQRNTSIRFAMVGVVNTFAGLAMICVARESGLDEVAANATGYAIGLASSFALNRRWTFSHRGSALAGGVRFVAVTLLAWFANVEIMLGLLRFGFPAIVAQSAAVLPYALVSYVGCRWWVFRAATEMKGAET